MFVLARFPRNSALCHGGSSRAPRELCADCGAETDKRLLAKREPGAKNNDSFPPNSARLLSSAPAARFEKRERAGRNLCGGGRDR